MASQLSIAVLGTGIMGAAMARNLLRAGHTVRVWNRTRARAESLSADGAVLAGTPAEAVADADVILTVLHDADAVREVMAGAAPAARRGAAWVQSTTVGVEDVGRLARLADGAGLVFFDAPVSGTREPAEKGQLVVLAAGPVTARTRVEPVFGAIGSRTVWTGEDAAAGPSTRLKLVVNSWVLAANNAAGEVLALAGALGVDPDRFFDVIDGGGLDLPYLRLKTAVAREGRLAEASFAVGTALKDARLILGAGRAGGVRLDGAEAFAARLQRAADAGHAADDMAASYLASFDAGPAAG